MTVIGVWSHLNAFLSNTAFVCTSDTSAEVCCVFHCPLSLTSSLPSSCFRSLGHCKGKGSLQTCLGRCAGAGFGEFCIRLCWRASWATDHFPKGRKWCVPGFLPAHRLPRFWFRPPGRLAGTAVPGIMEHTDTVTVAGQVSEAAPAPSLGTGLRVPWGRDFDTLYP